MIFVSVDNGIYSQGFRKVAAIARSIDKKTEVCYLTPTNASSLFNLFFKPGIVGEGYSEDEISEIAAYLSKSDMVCFSSMTLFAEITKRIQRKIKIINPHAFLIWGGIHPILNPEDAILHADAICMGEGENAFRNFYHSYVQGKDFTHTDNFWFNCNNQIIKNGFLPLNTSEEMSNFPLPLYADNEIIYKKGKGFRPLTNSDYISYNNLRYMVMWTIGCPYKCSYCGNSKFIENDSNYRKIRYPSVDYIIGELKFAIGKHPHISNVTFGDDAFIALPKSVLEEFAVKYKQNIGLPFFIAGINPLGVDRKKIEILINAGMNRVRMGIQSGSERILKFYNRPYGIEIIKRAMITLSDCHGRLMPPNYDIIVDNPIETKQDVIDTLELLYDAPRPYSLSVFALRVIPGTKLENDFVNMNIRHKGIEEGFQMPETTLANLLIYIILVIKPPRVVFNHLLKYVKPFHESQSHYPLLFGVFKNMYLIKKMFQYICKMEFSGTGGQIGWVFWKLGIIRLWRNKVFITNED